MARGENTDGQTVISVMLAVTVLLLVWLARSILHTYSDSQREACHDLCEDFGETAYYSAIYGCYCVTADGQRYNPDMLMKTE